MWNEILDLAVKNGLWAVLFLALLIYVLKDSSTREKKYQKTIQELTEHLNIVHEIKKEVADVKEVIYQSKKIKKTNTNLSKEEKHEE